VQLASIEYAVIKGAAVRAATTCEITTSGVPGDRRFVVFDRDATQLYAHRSPKLCTVEAAIAADVLSIRVPGGDGADGRITHGPDLGAVGWDEKIRHGRVVEGPFGALLSRHLRRPVELLDLGAWETRGVDVEPITLVSTASIEHLRARLRMARLDHRRFRANLVLAAADRPHQEDEWIGAEIAVGSVRLQVTGQIPRCAVITRDPDTGERDADALREVRRYRGTFTAADGARGIPFGVYARVVNPGLVRVGDAVRV
jgi:uncharacterized protein